MSRIAIVGDNSIEYINCLINIWNNNNCAVLINPQTPICTMIKMMIEANVSLCYIEQSYYAKVHAINNINVRFIPYERKFFSTNILPETSYNKFTENYSHDEALIIYSSGTTGKSQGIILSHYAINTNADSIIDYMKPEKSDCMYIAKHIMHSSTITGELLVALKTRTPILVAPVIVPPRYVLNNISKYCISIIGVNPLMLSAYINEYKNKNYNISSLKKIYVSGSILSDKIYNLSHKVLNTVEIYNVYGLTEAAPRVTAQRSNCCKNNSVGKAIKNVEIAVIDENGIPVKKGNYGIVHINSPTQFNGYVSGISKNKSLYRGWLNSGDIGYVDNDDELHIVGRIDDMIIINGHKIYPSEIEKHIYSCADVNECIVTAIPYDKENILCCLYTSDSDMPNNIKFMLSNILMKHEIPKVFVKTKAIPKNENGKINLQAAKELLLNSRIGYDI